MLNIQYMSEKDFVNNAHHRCHQLWFQIISNVLFYFLQGTGNNVVIVPTSAYVIGQNRCGGPQIIYRNYTFNVHRQMGCEYGKYWACASKSSKRCNVSIIRSADGSLIHKGQHNHPPQRLLIPNFMNPKVT